jgi:hypothetical protein
MISNNRRYDLSDSLIHFFRDIDLDASDAPAAPEHWGHSSIAEDCQLPAAFLQRHAIRQGRLWATWSVRSGKRTVYGPRPAVCFTEMPIPAFIEASRIRALKGQKMSSYALVLPKVAVFRDGGRPVIYGLSQNTWPRITVEQDMRFFAEETLPSKEQFRYVSFDPTKGTLDWSHEREWRWPLDVNSDIGDGSPPESSEEIPGLNLDNDLMQGMGVIVGSDLEAQQVIYDILTKVDRGDISSEHYAFVIAHRSITNWDDLRDYNEMEAAVAENLISLEPYFSSTDSDAEEASTILKTFTEQLEKNTSSDASEAGERGGCWLWLADNRHSLVRALVHAGHVTINEGGKYLVQITEIDQTRPLRQREEMITALAKRLGEDHQISATYFSVLNSTDPNQLPFYNGDLLDDRFFYNGFY